jgi:hypothetical protein
MTNIYKNILKSIEILVANMAFKLKINNNLNHLINKSDYIKEWK